MVILLSLTLAMAVPAMATVVPQTIYVHNTSWAIDNTQWHFIINQIDNKVDAPSSIHVVWSDGSTSDPPLDKFTGKVAHYVDTAHLNLFPKWDSFLKLYLVSAQINCSYGNFNISHGPGPGTPTPEMPAVALLGFGVAGIAAFVYFQRRKSVTTV